VTYVDPELAAQLALIPPLPFEDLEATRAAFTESFDGLAEGRHDGVLVSTDTLRTPDGATLPLRVFRPQGGRARKAVVLDLHGGGFAIGSAAMDDPLNLAIAREVDAVVVAVDYRLSPEHPYPTPAEDCYSALLWVVEHADRLGVDPARLAVHGDSAGGGLAATVGLWARDRGGPSIRFLSLLEPELDDRCDSAAMLAGEDAPVWYRSNAVLSWRYYLDGAAVDEYAVPARHPDLSGLPPTYLTVNPVDPLRDEGIAFAVRLVAAGVPTELRMWPGTYHGFDLVESAAISRRAGAALHDVLRRGLYG
jgi:acetyl esterase/lipase